MRYMRYMRYAILGVLFSGLLAFVGLLAIDTEVARVDYLRAKSQGDYEEKIDGCIFQFVCDHYTKQLWK